MIAQFDVGSNAAELLQQAEDALNDFLEENDIEDFFGDEEEYFDYDGEYTDNDDGDEEYDEDYEEEYDEDYEEEYDEEYEEEYDEDYDEQYDAEFDENEEDYYADWYDEWEGWGDNDWKDYWYQLVDAVYEFVDWATYEFGLDDEDWNSLFDYYYDGYFGFLILSNSINKFNILQNKIILNPIKGIIRQKITGITPIAGIIGTIPIYGMKIMMTKCQHGIVKNTTIVRVVTVIFVRQKIT